MQLPRDRRPDLQPLEPRPEPARSGEQAMIPARAGPSAKGASRAIRHGPPSSAYCTRTASPCRVSRAATSVAGVASGSGITDQSDRGPVTTTLKCITPSVYSIPVLIQAPVVLAQHQPRLVVERLVAAAEPHREAEVPRRPAPARHARCRGRSRRRSRARNPCRPRSRARAPRASPDQRGGGFSQSKSIATPPSPAARGPPCHARLRTGRGNAKRTHPSPDGSRGEVRPPLRAGRRFP